jgi:predicted transcriptional regulator
MPSPCAPPARHPETVSVRLRSEDYTRLEKLAWERRQPRGVFARQLLLHALDLTEKQDRDESIRRAFD